MDRACLGCAAALAWSARCSDSLSAVFGRFYALSTIMGSRYVGAARREGLGRQGDDIGKQDYAGTRNFPACSIPAAHS